MAVGERGEDVHRECRFAIASDDHRRAIRAIVAPLADEILDAVIEGIRAAVDLIEEPGEVLTADLVDGLKEVRRLGMLERPALEERGEDPLHDRPAEMVLERVHPECGLVVGNDRSRRGPVAECRRGLHVGLGVVAISGDSIVVDASEGNLGKRPRHMAAKVAQLPAIVGESFVEHTCDGVGVDSLVHPGVLELVGSHHAVPPLMTRFMCDGHLRRLASA